jgi:hypothetical protein
VAQSPLVIELLTHLLHPADALEEASDLEHLGGGLKALLHGPAKLSRGAERVGGAEVLDPFGRVVPGVAGADERGGVPEDLALERDLRKAKELF